MSINADLIATRAERDAARSELATTRAELEQARRDAAKHTLDLTELRSRADRAEAALAQLRESMQLAAVTEQRDKLAARVAELETLVGRMPMLATNSGGRS